MTDLIPRDAAMAECQKVADEAKSYGILQMTMGANTCRDALRSIPTIDPAAIREAALREALALSLEVGLLDETAILALIGEANFMIGEKK